VSDDAVKRGDFERAIRSMNLTGLHNRDATIQLAAHVMALTEVLGVGDAVAEKLPALLEQIRIADLGGTRVALDIDPVRPTADVPCLENMPICKARCCVLEFALSSEDLDAGVVKWDYGRPYLIRQRASDGKCVHNDAQTGHCTVHDKRPHVCRGYDCRNDKRIWVDYDKRIPRERDDIPELDLEPEVFDAVDRLRRRQEAEHLERVALDTGRHT